MKNIFVVTSGEYSDYGVDAIFTTRELAQKFIDAFAEDKWHQMDIEEWQLDPNEQHLKQNRTPFFLRINKDGDIRDLKKEDRSFGFKNDIPEANLSFTADDQWLNLYLFADDEKHATKIAGEKRTQVLATNSWGSKNFFENFPK